jgi:hypothetical protein
VSEKGDCPLFRYTSSLFTEASRTALIAFLAIAAGFTWQTIKTALIPVASPDRLVAELRLAQVGALLLSLTGGAYIGFASSPASEMNPGAGADIALAVGFFLIAATTLVRDPRQALTILALAFASHAIVDVAHRPGLLPAGIAPRWYSIGCAVFDVYIGALCYLPILRR